MSDISAPPPAGTLPTGAPGEFLPAVATGPDSFGYWGMWGLIGTEALLFGSLIVSYYYLRFVSPQHNWPPHGLPLPDLTLPLIMTVILWTSSLPVHLAHKAIKRGDVAGLRRGLLFGFVLGAAFLTLQFAKEWPDTLKLFTPHDDAYGSLFYTITGFHGFHVFVGLCISAFVQVRAWQGGFDRRRHQMVQNFAMYWHFVDAVWAVIVTLLYVVPNLRS